MEYINFEWDENKNRINKAKHGIDFEEAATVFYDEMAIVIGDTEHSGEEDRLKQAQVKRNSITIFERGVSMKEEYDFSNGVRNPYVKKLKKQITINIDNDTVDFFKEQSKESGIPYQTLINLYLSDCAKHKKQLQISWE